jgi:predicted phosphodiesterase
MERAPVTTTPADSPIRILHLSDFHFSTRSQWDADPILRALAGFIAADAAENALYPDLVIITGDLAQSGKRNEYALARQWLEDLWPHLTRDPATPLPSDRLLLVPGNHDVDWNLIEPGARDAHQALLAAKTQDAVTDRLKSKDTRELLFKRHAAYLRFHGDWLKQRQSLPWWQRRIRLHNQDLHVAGLDSAWLAGGDDDSRLLLGTYQINQTVLHPKGEGGCDWRIALLHHPWASLAEFDRNDAQRTLHRHRDLILRGHLHEPDLFRIVPADPRRSCIEAAAGCCYSGKPYPNAFQWVELHRDPRRVLFHFRCWNQGDWQVDRNQPGCPEGTHTIDLPAAAGAVRSSPHPTRKADRQVDTHLPECPEGTHTVDLPAPADGPVQMPARHDTAPVPKPSAASPDGINSGLHMHRGRCRFRDGPRQDPDRHHPGLQPGLLLRAPTGRSRPAYPTRRQRPR